MQPREINHTGRLGTAGADLTAGRVSSRRRLGDVGLALAIGGPGAKCVPKAGWGVWTDAGCVLGAVALGLVFGSAAVAGRDWLQGDIGAVIESSFPHAAMDELWSFVMYSLCAIYGARLER
jgi:hypothetical protein